MHSEGFEPPTLGSEDPSKLAITLRLTFEWLKFQDLHPGCLVLRNKSLPDFGYTFHACTQSRNGPTNSAGACCQTGTAVED